MTHCRVEKCPYCGEREFVAGIQQRGGSMTSTENPANGTAIKHVICRKCGSIVRSYVDRTDIFEPYE